MSVVALGILVVGVTGIIVGGEFLLPSPDYPKTKAEDRRSPSQAATSAAPVQPPAVAAPATAEAPIAETPVATPPATPPPPVASTPRSTARSGGRVGPAPPAQPAGARLQRTYEQAIAALQARDFAGAIALFEQIEREQPGLLDVPARLAASREALRESRHAAAQAALAAGVGAEQRGDLVEAQKEYQRALDADPACGGDEALRRVRAQMKTLGNEALKRAKTFDALSRTEDAIAQYERAVQLLPPDDPNRKTAKERLDILRASFIKEPRR